MYVMLVVSQSAFVGKYTDFMDMQGMDKKFVYMMCFCFGNYYLDK
jgi:hypothetical protein